MRKVNFVLVLGCLCLMSTVVQARLAEVLLFEGVDALSGGRFDGTTLTAQGVILPGYQVDSWKYPEAKGFTSIADRGDGKVYMGTRKGEILVFDHKAGTFSSVYKSEGEKDKLVTDLLFHGGQLWGAFAPSGRLIRIDSTGTVHDVADVKASYVWSIVPDGDSNVRIGTGAPGQVLSVDATGTVGSRLAVDAEHVTDLKVDGRRIFMSTAMPGRLLSAQDNKSPRVLFDLGRKTEAHRIRVTGDGVYVAVNSGKDGGGVVPPPSNKEKKRAPGTAGDLSKPNLGEGAFGKFDTESSRLKAPKGASVWFVDHQGSFRLVASLGKRTVLDMVGDGEGVLVAFSKNGRVERVHENSTREVVVDAAQAHITALTSSGWLVSASGASVQKFAPDAKRAHYYSKVRDFGAVVRVGNVDWVGENVRMEVRTGSTAEISEANWTSFSKVPALGGVPQVKAGRFFQFRATLSGADTNVKAVRVNYQAPNLAPTIHRIHVIDRKFKVSNNKSTRQSKFSRKVWKASKALSSSKAKSYTGIKRIGFDVQDLNGDYMTYHVSVRRIGDRVWVPLTSKTGAFSFFVDWFASEWPEGDYEIKVQADDHLQNAPGEGLSGTLVGGPIRIDNTAPVVSDISIRNGKLRFRVLDRFSKIRRVRVALGSGSWQILAPNDGIVDSSDEFFAVELKALGLDSSTMIRIQAQDTFGHLGRGGIEVRR